MSDTESTTPSLRESLEAAYSEASAQEGAPAETPATEAAAAPEPESTDTVDASKPPSGRPRDEKGRFAPSQLAPARGAPEQPAEAAAALPVPAASAAASAPPPPTSPPPPQAEPLRPPASWKPLAREKWGALTPEVQAEVIRREKEFQGALQEHAEAKKGWSSFREAVSPYEAMIRAEGGEPIAAVRSLLQTAAALRTAPPAHKAQLLAGVVRQFGVPIDLLDAALAGQPMPQGQGAQLDPTQLAQQIEQRVFQSFQAQQQQVMRQRASQRFEEWAQGKDFIDDVREDMADLLEVAARREKTMTLDEAYQKACALHPEVSKVMSQREAQKAQAQSAQKIQKAKLASSSVRTNPAPGAPKEEARGLRAQLQAAFDSYAGQ